MTPPAKMMYGINRIHLKLCRMVWLVMLCVQYVAGWTCVLHLHRKPDCDSTALPMSLFHPKQKEVGIYLRQLDFLDSKIT